MAKSRPVFKYVAFSEHVLNQLVMDQVGKGSTFPRSQLAEYRIVLLDKTIQQRGLGPMPRITRWIDEGRCARLPHTGSSSRHARPGE